MKYNLRIVLLLGLTISLFAFKGEDEPTEEKKFKLPKGVSSKDYLPNTIIIKYKEVKLPSSSSSGKGFGTQSERPEFNVKVINKKPYLNPGLIRSLNVKEQKSVDKIGLNRIYELNIQSNQSIESAINEILKNPDIEYAEPSYIYHTYATPNDPAYLAGLQNYLNQVKAPEAWSIQPNANGEIIAIVDSGSDLDHQDLAANIYYNFADPINGIDDDGDGYVDNYRGWDFVGASGSNITEDNNPDIPADSLDHGVHVSGIASAVTNNGIGVASIAQTAKLMILKVGADNNSTAIYRGYDGIFYAASRGVKIINCSWGGPGGGAFGQDMINFAVSKGSLVVVAAGNGGNDDPEYPAAYNGAFAVANVNSSDIKSNSSSYGYNVKIAAPGTNIYNTINGNKYGTKSGTSMATPMVSSAAALVAAKNPTLTGVQIGEILRLSADDINNINSRYANRIGRGRLNVYKALTLNSSPSIINVNKTITDPTGSLAAGDTVGFVFRLKNILLPASDIQVTLSSTSSNVIIINPTINLGALATSEEKLAGPFLVYIKPGANVNEEVVFKLTYASASTSYQDSEFFSEFVNLDYQNVTVNQIKTTITSNGRIGYSKNNAIGGLGFIYKDNSLLYEASLLIGNSAAKVSNNARTNNGLADEHFVRRTVARGKIDANGNYEGFSEFADLGTNSPLNVEVKHTMRAFKDAPNDKYVLVDYEIKNKGTVTLNNVFTGLFTDWDINPSDKNITKYNPDLRMGYTYSTNSEAPYAAVKILNTNYEPVYYPMSYQLTGDILEDDSFSIADKYKTLSSGIFATSKGEASGGVDVMYVIGAGPFSIPVNSTVKVSYALIAGDNLQDIETSAANAQIKYMQSQASNNVANDFKLFQNYPNPVVDDVTTLEVYVPDAGNIVIRLFDITGKQIQLVTQGNYPQGYYKFSLNTSALFPGVYYAQAVYNDKRQQTVGVVVN